MFHCPCCNAQLSAPSSIASNTVPCPHCKSQISAPSPLPQPVDHGITIFPHALHPNPQPISVEPTIPATRETIRAEPLHTIAHTQHPAAASPSTEYVSRQDASKGKTRTVADPSAVETPRKKAPKKNSALRVLISFTILATLAIAAFCLYQFLTANNPGLTTSTGKKTAPAPPTANIQNQSASVSLQKESYSAPTTGAAESSIPLKPKRGIEEKLEPNELPIIAKEKSANKEKAPDKPNIEALEPVAPPPESVESPSDEGAEVGKLVEDFIEAKTLEQRLPMASTRKSLQDLQNTIMNKTWPSARVSPSSQITHSAERLVEYYFEVRFDNNSMNFPKEATILVQKRTDEAPKIILEPLLDTIGGWLAEYAKTPSDEPQDFYVIMDARVKCIDNAIPGAHKKSTFFLRAHNTGEDLATAYADEQSTTLKLFDNPLEGLKWKNPMPAIVTLKWNKTEDGKRPFLELMAIKSTNWNQ